MDKYQIYRINSPQIVCETIDGEVVIVNLDKGYYYSLLKTGAEIWSRIERQLDRTSIVAEISCTYDGDIEEISTAIDRFLEELQREEIIVPHGIGNLTRVDEQVPNKVEVTDKRLFERPILEKFTDMEDLLLLDPIHEVDVDAGWPNTKTG
uniref:Coenzyme PQQ synthesis D n=1 Tax=Cyanothece sp. (strain PCC 7425 / ATCC 29141) TaxID=395961 RepID=B8HPW6_CYAP4